MAKVQGLLVLQLEVLALHQRFLVLRCYQWIVLRLFCQLRHEFDCLQLHVVDSFYQLLHECSFGRKLPSVISILV